MILSPREIWSYVRVVLRWWWVILLAAVLAAGVAGVMAARQPSYYLSRTTMMVGDTLTSAIPDAQLIGLSSALAGFYSEMAKREPILAPVTERLGLPFSWQIVSRYMLSTNVNRQASLLEITVTDTNPERAAAVAAAVAEELVRFSPNSPEKIAAQRSLIDEQLNQTESNLASIERTIEEARAQQAQLTGAADLREVRNRIEELERTRAGAQETYNQLVRLQSSSVANSLTVVEPAQIPIEPLPNKRLLTIAMAGIGGLLLGIIAAFLLELIDDRWRNKGDLNSRFGLSVLGWVPGNRPLLSLEPEQALLREAAVRDAHTHIVLSGTANNTRTILVSSPRPSEARSSFAIDLAQLYTRSGYRVLLVDADTESATLTRMLGGDSEARRPVVLYNGEPEMWSSLQATPLKNVMLLGHNTGPDGRPLPPSLPWPALVENLHRAADVVIFDGPSALSGVDAALLAPLLDGVVLTLNPDSDTSRDIQESKLRLTRQDANKLLGAVVLAEAQQPAAPSARLPFLPPALVQRLLGPGTPAPVDPASLDVAANAAGRVIVTPASLSEQPAPAQTAAEQELIEIVDLPADEDAIDTPAASQAGQVLTADMIFGPAAQETGDSRALGQPAAAPRVTTAPDPA